VSNRSRDSTPRKEVRIIPTENISIQDLSVEELREECKRVFNDGWDLASCSDAIQDAIVDSSGLLILEKHYLIGLLNRLYRSVNFMNLVKEHTSTFPEEFYKALH